jgi:hypothetical protein
MHVDSALMSDASNHWKILLNMKVMSIPFIFQRTERIFSVAILEVAGIPLGLQMTERIFPIAVAVVSVKNQRYFLNVWFAISTSV